MQSIPGPHKHLKIPALVRQATQPGGIDSLESFLKSLKIRTLFFLYCSDLFHTFPRILLLLSVLPSFLSFPSPSHITTVFFLLLLNSSLSRPILPLSYSLPRENPRDSCGVPRVGEPWMAFQSSSAGQGKISTGGN